MSERSDSITVLPFRIESSEIGSRLDADMYGVVEQPFDKVTNSLSDTASWCEFMPLNLNIKSCITQRHAGEMLLTFYAGRKYYEAPESAYQIHYIYHMAESNPGYLKVGLYAPEGPFGTSDYSIIIEAMPADGHTFLRIHSSYETSFSSRLGTRIYLATLGQDKVGFSMQKGDNNATPTYIKGIRGVIERNVMRYYLALKAFLDTNTLAPAQRFEARIKSWYDLTEIYPVQLHELERDDYLDAKRRERVDQQRLQQMALDS